MDGNVDFFMDSLKNPQIQSVKMSAFSLSTLIGISALCTDLRGLSYLLINLIFSTNFIEMDMRIIICISNGTITWVVFIF